LQATLIGAHVHEQAARSNSLGGAKAQQPFIIGVAGGTASGKTSVCRSIVKKLMADGV
jgi:pantothenate kinase